MPSVVQATPLVEQFGAGGGANTSFASGVTAGNDVWALVQFFAADGPVDSVSFQGVAGTLESTQNFNAFGDVFTYAFYVWRGVSAGAGTVTVVRATTIVLVAIETTPDAEVESEFAGSGSEGNFSVTTEQAGNLAFAGIRSEASTGMTGTGGSVVLGNSGDWNYAIYEEFAGDTGNALGWTKTAGTYRGTVGVVLADVAGGPTLVAVERGGAWSVRNLRAVSRSGTWSVRNLRTVSRSGTWSVRNLRAVSRSGAWSVRNLTGATRGGAWSVRNLAGAERSGAWSVRNLLDVERSGAWSVRNLLDIERLGAWSVRNLVAVERSGAWSVQETGIITVARSGAWSVRNLLEAERSGAWSVRNLVDAERSGAWSVRNLVDAERPGAWSVRNLIAAERSGAWSVEAEIERLAVERSGAWSVRNLIVVTRSGAWSVDGVVEPLTDAEMRDLYERIIALQAQLGRVERYASLIPALL